MNYDEFKNLIEVKDSNNPFSKKYLLDSGEVFYIEPAFYSQMNGFETYFPNEYSKIVQHLFEVVKKNKNVVFTGNFETPQTDVDGFIFLEITDITDPLKIYAEDKSRGSDYGD